MQVITTHQNADFDALASMVAASKLYPQAQAVYPSNVNSNIQKFISLYKDILPIKTVKEIDLASVTQLVVTDTRQKNRLQVIHSQLDKLTNIQIYDHHPETKDDLVADVLVAEQIGATTTLLVERLFSNAISITPFEATLFVLGIFEDTGCLTFGSTSLRDVEAVYHLWQIGVNLRIISSFLNQPLTLSQRDLLDELLSATTYYEIHGVRVGITCMQNGGYVGGLALLTHKLLEIEDVDIIFTVVSMDGKVFLVGRSRAEHINLVRILADLGAKGHRSAASATVRDAQAADVQEKLLLCLYRDMPPAKTVREIMSSPVRTLLSETTVDEARTLMLRYGHSGFPVMEDGRLAGIISRRDLDKASHHGLGHAPVKGYMSVRPITVVVATSIREAQHIMVTKDVGRLPVMEGDAVIGLVTRTDLLRILEGDQPEGKTADKLFPAAGDDITPLLKERLSQKMQGKLMLIGQKADRENVKVYVVGGFVRDLLLGLDTHDLDLVVEPLAIPFAQQLHDYLGGRIVVHEQFGTATLTLTDGTQIDLATARQEFYARPAAMPQVESSSLRNDLFRRDFTINTLAFSLNSPYYGHLTDFFGGLYDLEHGIIRVLYNLSFVEDPLRVLRAVRFEQRFGFTLEATTKSLIENAAQTRVIEKVAKERLHDEFALFFQEKKVAQMLDRLFTLGISASLFTGVNYSSALRDRLFAVRDILQWCKRTWPQAQPLPEVIYLAAVLLDSPFQEARHLCRRLRIPKEATRRILLALEAVPRLLGKLAITTVPSQLDDWLHEQPIETLLLLLARSENSHIWQNVSIYWEKLQKIQTEINGHDLEALGFRPGPAFQTILTAVRAARLDGVISTKEEELTLAQQLLTDTADGEENSNVFKQPT